MSLLEFVAEPATQGEHASRSDVQLASEPRPLVFGSLHPKGVLAKGFAQAFGALEVPLQSGEQITAMTADGKGILAMKLDCSGLSEEAIVYLSAYLEHETGQEALFWEASMRRNILCLHVSLFIDSKVVCLDAPERDSRA